MRDDLKQLLLVQELDMTIRGLTERKLATAREMEDLRREVERDEKAIEDEKALLQGSRVKMKDLELSIAYNKNHIDKYQEQLFKIKNNKEYTALLHEMKKIEADISLQEDEMLVYMEEAEEEDQKLDGTRADLEIAKKKYRKNESEARDLISLLEKDIEGKKEEKKKEASLLDPDIYETYEIIFSRKPDRAVVKVVNGTCGGCNMELTSQVLNELHRNDSLLQCETCGRFLYII